MKKEAEKKRPLWPVIPIVIVLLIAIYVTLALTAAVPKIRPVKDIQTTSYISPTNSIAWPTAGQSAIGINNAGVVAAYGNQVPVPTASTAKVITALCVLKKDPLSVGQSGPTIALTQADVNLYNKYQAEDGSDMQIVNGEQLSEYQMLQAMLLPSADNIADSLAIWAFGSLNNYSTYANQYLKTNGLTSTHVGIDASGFDPSTTSTASDLVKVGELAMDNAVLSGIVAQPSASGFPIVGNIKNVNSLLGQESIVGIKTGNTDQAGGVFLSASRVIVNDQDQTIVTATMQAATLFDALHQSLPLITSAQGNFSTPPEVANIQRGTVVGQYNVPWNGQTIQAIASQPIDLKSWGDSDVTQTISLNSISYKAQKDQVVGTITTRSKLLNNTNSIAAILSQSPVPPSKVWTLLHPESFIHI